MSIQEAFDDSVEVPTEDPSSLPLFSPAAWTGFGRPESEVTPRLVCVGVAAGGTPPDGAGVSSSSSGACCGKSRRHNLTKD